MKDKINSLKCDIFDPTNDNLSYLTINRPYTINTLSKATIGYRSESLKSMKNSDLLKIYKYILIAKYYMRFPNYQEIKQNKNYMLGQIANEELEYLVLLAIKTKGIKLKGVDIELIDPKTNKIYILR